VREVLVELVARYARAAQPGDVVDGCQADAVLLRAGKRGLDRQDHDLEALELGEVSLQQVDEVLDLVGVDDHVDLDVPVGHVVEPLGLDRLGFQKRLDVRGLLPGDGRLD
jgi:hypothetical protein